jgi:hypothetical protein
MGTHSTAGLKALFIYIFLIRCSYLIAQPALLFYADAGENVVSQGLFLKSAIFGQFKYGKNMAESGFQIDLKSNNKSVFSGYRIDVSREIQIKDKPIELHAFFFRTPFSGILHETNWGPFLKIKRKHFEMAIGTNFRTYSFSRKAVKEYSINKNDAKIHEVFNIIYAFSYNLKPPDNPWNVGLTVTDIDYFSINQETNPMFNMHGFYKLSLPVRLYLEAWYKIAGASNLDVNYFGFYFRTGILWDIK